MNYIPAVNLAESESPSARLYLAMTRLNSIPEENGSFAFVINAHWFEGKGQRFEIMQVIAEYFIVLGESKHELQELLATDKMLGKIIEGFEILLAHIEFEQPWVNTRRRINEQQLYSFKFVAERAAAAYSSRLATQEQVDSLINAACSLIDDVRKSELDEFTKQEIILGLRKVEKLLRSVPLLGGRSLKEAQTFSVGLLAQQSIISRKIRLDSGIGKGILGLTQLITNLINIIKGSKELTGDISDALKELGN